jgi:hypothetical protein
MSSLLKQSIPRRISVEFDVFHKWKFMDRVRIILGYNVIARVKVNVDKRTGEAFQICQLGLTDAASEKDVIKQQHLAQLTTAKIE